MTRLLPASLLLLGLCAAPVLAEPTDGGASPGSLAKPRAVSKQADKLLEAAWKEAGLKPRKKSSDAEFLRRASLDLAGSIPDEDLARAFLQSKNSGKRAELVRQLVASDAYARTMSQRWANLLVGRDYLMRMQNVKQVRKAMQARRDMGMGGSKAGEDMEPVGYDLEAQTLSEWLTAGFRENRPWDAMTRDLIGAEGTVDKNPAAHYLLRYARNGKAEEMTGSAMRVFQGLQIQCAQCHDHPYEDWTQRQFYGIAAFFSRTAARRTPPPPGAKPRKNGAKARGPFRVYERGNTQIRIPAAPGETGPLVLPQFLDGKLINPGPTTHRRRELGKLITAADNPYFAKATVNRLWSFFFGHGVIDPVDNISAGDPYVPGLLELLAEDFQRSGYDLARLAEIITNTRAYQLSSAGPDETRDAELELFARAPLRALSAEQLFYSVLEATGVEDLRTANRRALRRIERRKYQLFRQFVSTFGDDEGEEVVEEGTIPQALMRLNGTLTNDAVRARPGHPVYDRLFAMNSLEERVDTIYLRVLSREPTNAEKRTLTKFLRLPENQKAEGLARAFSDVFWALLNSSEFNFNH